MAPGLPVQAPLPHYSGSCYFWAPPPFCSFHCLPLPLEVGRGRPQLDPGTPYGTVWGTSIVQQEEPTWHAMQGIGHWDNTVRGYVYQGCREVGRGAVWHSMQTYHTPQPLINCTALPHPIFVWFTLTKHNALLTDIMDLLVMSTDFS